MLWNAIFLQWFGVELLVWMNRTEKQVSWVCQTFPPAFSIIDKQKLPPFFHAEPPGLWPHTWDVSSLSIWLTWLSTLCLLLPIGIRAVVNVRVWGEGRNCSTTWRFVRHTPTVFMFVWRCRGPGWKLIFWVGSNRLAMPGEIHPQFPGCSASTLSLKSLLSSFPKWGPGGGGEEGYLPLCSPWGSKSHKHFLCGRTLLPDMLLACYRVSKQEEITSPSLPRTFQGTEMVIVQIYNGK